MEKPTSPMQAPPNIHQRLNAVMKEVSYVKKDARITAGTGSYKAVSHNNVTAITRNEFIDAGINIIVANSDTTTHFLPREKDGQPLHPVVFIEGKFVVRFVNVDNPEDFVDEVVPAHAEDYGDKGAGKITSYAVKTAIIKILQLESGESDESRIQPDEVEEKKTIEPPTSKSGKSQSDKAMDQPHHGHKSDDQEWKDPATPAKAADVSHLDDRAVVEKCSAGTAKMIKSYVDLKGAEALKHVKQAMVNLNIDKFSDMPKAEAKMLLDHLKSMPDNDAVGNV